MLKAYTDMQLENEKYGKFIRHFYTDDLNKQAIILFEQWQVEYTKRMCKFNPFKCSRTETDKTFNMSQ